MLTSTETGGRRSQIFYRMREFICSREAIPRVWLRAAVFYGNRRRSSNQRAQKVRNTSATSVSRLLPAAPEAPSLPVCRSLGAGSRLLFDFGKERLETLTPGVSIFGQPGLEQTQKTKSVVYTQRRATPRTLVRLMRAHCVQISDAIEYHWGRQIAAARGNLYVACSALAASTPQR